MHDFDPVPMLRVVPETSTDGQLSLDELGSRIVGLAGRLAAATCRWLLLVAEFDAREGYAPWGLPHTAAWLMHTCALSRRTAFEHVRVARALATHPKLAGDMQRGRLSYSQVRAISRVVRPGDERTTEDLAEAAEHCSIGQLETVVRGMRTNERRSEGIVDDEDYVRTGWTDDSRWQLNARLGPEQGEFVHAAIKALATAEGLTHAEALVRMAEIALSVVNDSGSPVRTLRGDERAAVVVHLQTEAISAARECSAEHSRPAGRVANGPGLPWPTIEWLLCQGRIRTAVHDPDGNIVHLGRSHRVVPERLFRALLHRDSGHCRYPGCSSRAGLQAHHVRHWIDGGETDIVNLVLLCERHHRRHHDGFFTIESLGRGEFRFLDAAGRSLCTPHDRDVLARSAPSVDSRHADVPAAAATPRLDGTKMDRRYAIDCLVAARAGERAAKPPPDSQL